MANYNLTAQLIKDSFEQLAQVSGSIEALEIAETAIINRHSKIKDIISIGISEHLYKTTLCDKITKLGQHVHVKFDSKSNLIRAV